MGIIELFFIAVGLSMDAFAVSICKGLALKDVKLRHSVKAGLWFGGFQALMPVIGFFCGYWFKDYISAFDHWVAFILLLLLGAKMIKEALSDEEETTEAAMDVKNMLLLAIATSIEVGYDIFSQIAKLRADRQKLYVFGHFEYYNSCIGSSKEYTSKKIFAGGLNYYPLPQICVKAEYSYRKLKSQYNDEPALNIGVAYQGQFL